MSPACIGVFDSGLGGLTVLKALRAALPGAHFVYVADAGHCPYGGRPAAAITARAEAITEVLIGAGAELIVVACNTATIAAIESLRASYTVPFVGMEPAVKPAAARTRTGVIGVLATGAALAGEKMHRLIERHAAQVRVITQPCPGLVEQVEAGAIESPVTQALIQRYTAPLVAAGADVLVLGCTHYPFLRDQIAAIVGSGVELLDTADAVARRAASLWPAERAVEAQPGTLRLVTSGDPERVGRVASQLWGSPLTAEAMS